MSQLDKLTAQFFDLISDMTIYISNLEKQLAAKGTVIPPPEHRRLHQRDEEVPVPSTKFPRTEKHPIGQLKVGECHTLEGPGASNILQSASRIWKARGRRFTVRTAYDGIKPISATIWRLE